MKMDIATAARFLESLSGVDGGCQYCFMDAFESVYEFMADATDDWIAAAKIAFPSTNGYDSEFLKRVLIVVQSVSESPHQP